MKTLVVLSALASIAIAAPALPEFTQTDQDLHNLHHLTMREKKSPAIIPSGLLSNTENTQTDVHNFGAPTSTMGRSLSLKKPLIVKNKHGYRLYRDSEEEKALSGSHETCGRQIRVKLCDEDSKLRDMMRISANENGNIHMTEHDMKQSIQMAKEAMENLQRDLEKIEHDPASKITHGKSESDTELHEEIEVARQALDHIHKNFGNLESMSLHATTTRNSDAVNDVHLTIAKTEEERMAQWKKAMENIKKNAEIARNIEDSFKTPTDQADFSTDDTIGVKIEPKFDENIQEFNEDMPKATENEEKVSSCVVTNENREDKNAEIDMNGSASENTDTKIENWDNEQALRDALRENEKNTIGKLDTPTEIILDELSVPQVKSVELDTENGDESKVDTDKVTLLKESENNDAVMAASIATDTTVDPINPLITINNGESQRNTDEEVVQSQLEQQVGHEKQSCDETKDTSSTLTKSAEHLDHKNTNKEDTMTNLELEKAAKQITSQKNFKETEKAIPSQHIEEHSTRHTTKSSEQLEDTDFHDTEQTENFMYVKSADMYPQRLNNIDQDKLHHIETFASMKSAETEEELHLKDNNPTGHVDKMTLMKAAEEHLRDFHGHHDHNHFNNMNFNQHQHMHGEMDTTNEFDLSSHGQLHSPRLHHNMMAHGKMADMRAMHPSFHASMRDPVDGLGSDNMFRWNQMHESGRTAYGAGNAVASTGAVGVFPNANAGGCGIPLLLSCSPSVVSGSLAKPHPAASGAYTAPAYRTEDDFSFHNKRDIKKNNEHLTANALRTPMIAKQKSITMLEHRI